MSVRFQSDYQLGTHLYNLGIDGQIFTKKTKLNISWKLTIELFFHTNRKGEFKIMYESHLSYNFQVSCSWNQKSKKQNLTRLTIHLEFFPLLGHVSKLYGSH